MDFSEGKIKEVQKIIGTIINKIKKWDEDGMIFAQALSRQNEMLHLCGHESATHDLHKQEIDALWYTYAALNALSAKLGPNGDGNGGKRKNAGDNSNYI